MRRLRWVQMRDARAAGHHVDLDDITAGGPDYEDEGYEIVSESRADTEYAVGYAPDGTPVLIDEDAGCAYAVEAGAIYEQPYQGVVWHLADSWVESEVLWTEDLGEITHYAVGKAGDRYFFAWSEWKWPTQNEDGRDEVPADDIDDGINGIHWFASLAEAIDDARDAIEALDDIHPEWSEEALESLGDMVLTTGEAARLLGVTEMRIRHLCQAGRMGYKVRQDGQWLIPLRDVEGFQRRKPGRRKKEQPYERHGEWSGYTVRKSKKGFIVEWWSVRQGDITDAKYLVEYGDGYGPETDLASRHNELMTVGDYIYACTEDPAIARVRVRCLCVGRIVR